MGSDDDYSDLTELEESDDYADSKSKKKGKASSSGTGGWKVKSTLKPPRATTYTTQALYDQIVSDDINLEPEYQRDIVWPDSKQIMIIDSIYRNYYIPPIIFAVNYHEDGSESKTCIDGKQRLTSIHRFMQGLIPHKDPYTSEKLWYTDTGGYTGPKHRIIPEKYRKVFANKQIVCVEYHEIPESSEREVFQRVQLGMALTPAEKLQVIHTPRSSFIRDILLAHMKDGSLGGDALEWDTARGADFRCLAFAIYCMEKFSPALKPPGIPQVEKWLSMEDSFPAKFQGEVKETYRIFSEMAEDSKYNKAFKKPTKMSPIEFMIIGIFIYVHKDKASLAELSTGIGHMREDVRSVHVDIRLNSRVHKTLLEFIKAWVPGQEAKKAPPAKTTAVKRKRATKKGSADADDDDVEDEAPAAKTKKTTTVLRAARTATAPVASTSTRQIKAEPVPSPPPRAAAPTPAAPPQHDRMAVLRQAKERAQQSQRSATEVLPSGPRALGLPPTIRTDPLVNQNPQMLPSPGPTYASPAYTGGVGMGMPSTFQQSTPLPLPPPPSSSTSSSSIETSLMATMMGRSQGQPGAGGDGGRARQSSYGTLPPPPTSAGSRGADRDRDRDRDRRGSYDDRDRGNYSPQRRESGGYRGRSPDDRSRNGSGRWPR